MPKGNMALANTKRDISEPARIKQILDSKDVGFLSETAHEILSYLIDELHEKSYAFCSKEPHFNISIDLMEEPQTLELSIKLNLAVLETLEQKK